MICEGGSPYRSLRFPVSIICRSYVSKVEVDGACGSSGVITSVSTSSISISLTPPFLMISTSFSLTSLRSLHLSTSSTTSFPPSILSPLFFISSSHFPPSSFPNHLSPSPSPSCRASSSSGELVTTFPVRPLFNPLTYSFASLLNRSSPPFANIPSNKPGIERYSRAGCWRVFVAVEIVSG